MPIIEPDLEQGPAAPDTRLVTKKADLAGAYRSIFEQLVEAERHTDL